MAFGTRCLECGCQEIDHYREGERAEGDPSVRNEGYNTALCSCPGFNTNNIGFEYTEAIRLLGGKPPQTESDFDGLSNYSEIRNSPFVHCLEKRLKEHYRTTPRP